MRKTETRVSSTADDTDLQILSLLQGNARMSIKHIAEKTFLSPTAISEMCIRDRFISFH